MGNIRDITLLDKDFHEGERLTADELDSIVLAINDIIGYINNTVNEKISGDLRGPKGDPGTNGRNGENGSEGISTLTAFTAASSQSNALSKLDQLQTKYPPDNYSISPNVTLGQNQTVFMTSARRRGENNYLLDDDNKIWSIPVQIGAGTTSTTGVDSEQFNYVYCRTKKGIDATFPSNLTDRLAIKTYVDENPDCGIKNTGVNQWSYIQNMSSYDSETDAETLNNVWTDHPYGIDEFLPHEWMVGYYKNSNNQWEYYFGPIMTSNFGYNGLDADGLEYIFTANASNSLTLTPPYSGTIGDSNQVLTGVTVNSENYQNDDFIPSGWSDEPVGTAENIPYAYVSTRKQHKDQNGNLVWGAFTPPKLWGVFATEGVNGSFIQEVYRYGGAEVSSISQYLPTNTNGHSSATPYPPEGWSTVPNPLVGSGDHIWCIQRTIEYDASNNPIYLEWSDPFRITGDNGQPGEDGKYTEYVYKRFQTEQTSWSTTAGDYTNPANWPTDDNSLNSPDNPQKEDYTGPSGSKWSDNPQGIDPDWKFEYCAQRIYNGTSYEAFHTPILWSRFGDKGRDGDGYEYIFTHEFSGVSPSAPPVGGGPGTGGTYPEDWPNDGTTDHATDANGTVWYDDPKGVSETYPKEYVSMRKKTSTAQGSVWGPYSIPALWSNWVAAGAQGQNGQFTQFIYQNSATQPNTPSGNTETIPNDWTLIATSPSTGQYTWCSTRNVTFAVNTNVPSYGNWCAPYRITGEDGQPGKDGSFVEFIYTRNNTGIVPPAPPSNGTYLRDWPNVDGNTPSATITVDGQQYTWYDNPQGTSSGMKWEFVSSREYDGRTKSWGPYSTPGIWSKFGEDGRDGDGFEYIFKGFSTEPNWNNVSSDDYPPNWTSLTGFQDSDYRGPTGHLWEDDAIAVDNTNNKFVYMCSRKKYTDSGASRATWHQFSPPKLWAQYVAPGATGADGKYTQFIFKTTSTDLSVASNYQELGTSDSGTPSGWSETATSPSSTSEYIWCSHRVVTPGLNSSVTYGNWCPPYKISGTNGNNGSGTTTEVYQIIPSVETIHYKKNHAEAITWNPTTITFDIYKFSGTSFTQLTGNDLSGLSLTRRVYTGGGLYFTNTDGTAVIGSNDIIGNQYNDPITTVTHNSQTIIGTSVQIILKQGTTQLAIKNIPIIRDYQRMLIPCGAYENKEYRITDTTIPLVVGSDNKYYYLDADTNIKSGPITRYTSPTEQNQTVWAEATEYKVLLTEALFANFAKLGSFVIYGKYFFSQFGYVIDSSGNAEYKNSSATIANFYQYFDPDDPMAETNPTSGNYKFRPMKVINAESGEEWMAGGNIHMEANGSVTMQNAIVKNGIFVDRVNTLKGRLYTVGTVWEEGATATEENYYFFDVTAGSELSQTGYYDIGNITLKSNRLFIYKEGIDNYPYQRSGGSQLHLILPPPHKFVGQNILITNKSYGFDSEYSDITLEQEYIHYDAINDKFICLTDVAFVGDNYSQSIVSSDMPEGAPYHITETDPILLNGIWQLKEDTQNNRTWKYPIIKDSVSIMDYEWLELSAVNGEYLSDNVTTNPAVSKNYNVVWMIIRYQKNNNSISS